ncbi:hypothetical protein [Flavobacterium sp.]|uniref:hypothetical protein n=1 Tax=Flavobacterium sp. TaxID=239 RepID=UPI0040486D73
MKINLILLFTLFTQFGFTQSFEVPLNHIVVRETFGDLDADGIDEHILVCNTDKSENESVGFKRILYILKVDQKGKELLWKKNETILWDSKDCGMGFDLLQDPLVGLEIKRNTLIIKHKRLNNSRRTEDLKQIFRFQNNNWYLIGSTYRYADTCNFDDTYDINFSTNQVIITKITHDCQENEYQKDSYSKNTYSFNFQKIKMDDYKPTEIEIKPNLFVIY